jgi:hypothetical protein
VVQQWPHMVTWTLISVQSSVFNIIWIGNTILFFITLYCYFWGFYPSNS